jgi:hypothetical protein
MTTLIDPDEQQLLKAFDRGVLQSVATKDELASYRAAARVTPVENRPHDYGQGAPIPLCCNDKSSGRP